MVFEREVILLVTVLVLGAESGRHFLYNPAHSFLDRVVIIETTLPSWAGEILKEHGIFWENFVSKVKHICQSQDGKSNFIEGDAVCRLALPKLGLNGCTLSERAYCSNVTFTKYNKTKNNNYEPKDETAFMAKCVYKNAEGESGSFYVFNGPDKHFYYVFQMDANNKKVVVKACLNIEVKTGDFPKVTVKDTKDPSEADNIFGVYGRISDKKKSVHICGEKNEKNFAKICSAVIKSILVDVPLPKPSSKNPPKCEDVNIARNIINPTTFEVHYQRSRGLYCIFQDKEKDFKFMVFDGPSSEYYYLAKINGRNQMAIQACIKIPSALCQRPAQLS